MIGELIDARAARPRPGEALPRGPPHSAEERPGGLPEYMIENSPVTVVNRTYVTSRCSTEFMDEVRRLLAHLSEILARYDYDERASFVRGLAERSAQDDHFWHTLAGLEFWGGSGAVWEIGPFHLTDPSIAMPPSDYRRFKTLMVELAGILDSKSLGARASGIAEVFRRDLEAGS